MKNPIPPEDKNLKLKKVGCVAFLIVVALMVGVVFYLETRGGALSPPFYSSEMYDVMHNQDTNYITLTPKSGVKHDSTLIFMHGYTGSSDSMFVGSTFLTAL